MRVGLFIRQWCETVAFLGGGIGPWPPFGKTVVFFTIEKIRKTKFGSPLCVSTSGQQTFGPPLGNPKYATGARLDT